MAKKEQKISNQEPRGTRDWLPQEFLVRKYIFDTWRRVCLSYGYEEYLTPIIESAAIYKAKSGEDVGGKELMVFRDKSDRELAIRPEMTPSVTRMITKIYDSAPKPLKYFSIANFIRNEKPQRGRNREFWQLNFDCFGSEAIEADLEIAQIALDIMLEFNPPVGSFVMYLNNRKLIEDVLALVGVTDKKKLDLVRVLDKKDKMSSVDFRKALKDLKISPRGIDILTKFLDSRDLDKLVDQIPELKVKEGLTELKQLINALTKLGYGNWIEFNAGVIRGFDYYDGIIYEVFDRKPENNRAMFGGGRYNGLAEIFGSKSFPAVGMAPGDETIRLFLESWNLVDPARVQAEARYYFPLLEEKLQIQAQKLAKKLRTKQSWNIDLGLSRQKMNKALEYANKKGVNYVIIFGEAEVKKKIFKLKDMKTGKEKKVKL